MSSPFDQFVAEIHAASTRIVLAVTGGGSGAISRLLEVPGASRTVLEAVVPYAPASLAMWLGGRPDQACSARTARSMAMAAFRRATIYHDDLLDVAGIGCTASLATDRPKRGAHRVHVALQTSSLTATHSLQLTKGRRSRAEEEDLVDRLVLTLVAEACGLMRRLPMELVETERIETSLTVAPPAWRRLLSGQTDMVRHGTPVDYQGPTTRVVFPGAFNPLHAGHRRMAELARQRLGQPVEYEMSILNVDKPPLDYWEMERRTEQFAADEVVWLTRTPTFLVKSEIFPGATFLVGVDTLRRIADERYYRRDPGARDAALHTIAARGCHFLVFGRQAEGRFLTLADLELPEVLRRISRGVPAEEFREDISSTELRQAEETDRAGE
jgi:nicotinamide mononucleotide (NMN) deamidase PncC